MDGSTLNALIPYFVAAGGLLLVASLRNWRLHNQEIDKLLALLLILGAATVAGLVDLGTDVQAYRVNFDVLPTSTERYGWWEPGYEYIARIFATAGAPYGLFAFACVLTSHFIKLRVYDNVVSNRVLALFVLFCFNLGEVAFVRQYLAASLILLSFYLLSTRQSAWAILAIASATLIHKTALVAALIVVPTCIGRSALKPLVLAVLIMALATLVFPASIINAVTQRVATQIAAYTVEGYVQGLQDRDVSMARNLLKFPLYIALALWMVKGAGNTGSALIQRKAAYAVVALSVLSICLILLISPVFSRLSTYVFPFLALTVRTDRFVPTYAQLPAQFVVIALLLANLVISTYPLVEYL